MGEIVGLGGGIGSSRLWRVLARAVGPSSLTLIVNTAGDLRQHGLRICPDLDSTLYALSGRQDTERGWGLRDESFRCRSALRDLGGESWFSLGDLDLATHLYRTGLLGGGATLTEVTARLATAFGVRSRVLPMTDDDVTTMISTTDGRLLPYEEYLLREQAAPGVRGVRFDGIGAARPAPGVLAAIESADLIVLGPSNPVASMLPILGLPGVTQALEQHRDRVVAVSPVVAAVPFTDETERRPSLPRHLRPPRLRPRRPGRRRPHRSPGSPAGGGRPAAAPGRQPGLPALGPARPGRRVTAERKPPGQTPERVSFFTDAIFAIAMTPDVRSVQPGDAAHGGLALPAGS
jgi:LPPG:FO 2-phospho-L-lactate transferase